MTRFLTIVTFLILTVNACAPRQSTPLSDAEVAKQMLAATKRHLYDDAVQIGLNAMKSKPSDGLLISQIALVYVQRAFDDVQDREKWLVMATEYAEKSVGADPADELNLFTSARVYESSADLSLRNRCAYYDRSIALFNRISAGRSKSAYDEAAKSSEVLRKNSLDGVSRVMEKAKTAACAR